VATIYPKVKKTQPFFLGGLLLASKNDITKGNSRGIKWQQAL
jgi:hypothetical protein